MRKAKAEKAEKRSISVPKDLWEAATKRQQSMRSYFRDMSKYLQHLMRKDSDPNYKGVPEDTSGAAKAVEISEKVKGALRKVKRDVQRGKKEEPPQSY